MSNVSVFSVLQNTKQTYIRHKYIACLMCVCFVSLCVVFCKRCEADNMLIVI